MPELGEVAHAVGLLRKYVLGKTIKKAVVNQDDIVLVQPLTAEILQKAFRNKKVTDLGRHGKYFWMELGKSQTVLLHFGMTGWVHVRDVATHFIAMESGGDKKQKENIKALIEAGKDPADIKYVTEIWPPKASKFILETDDKREIAFTDPRRLGRIRLFDVPASEILQLDPLNRLGTDFSQDKGSLETFVESVSKRRVPVKALMLDQTLFSGIGNWMADEILFQARVHPEQYAHTLSEAQKTELYNCLLEVSKISAETEGNTAAFPKSWLMLYRWGKSRKKEVQKTADGHIVEYITVGGRTSCYVPELQVLGVTDDAGTIDSKGTKSKAKSAPENSVPTKKLKVEQDISNTEYPMKAESETDNETQAKTKTKTKIVRKARASKQGSTKIAPTNVAETNSRSSKRNPRRSLIKEEGD